MFAPKAGTWEVWVGNDRRKPTGPSGRALGLSSFPESQCHHASSSSNITVPELKKQIGAVLKA
jgi:hypothetical protein